MTKMRRCDNNYCLHGMETEWVDDGTEYGYYKLTGEMCYLCEGKGEIEDVCYCNAYEPNECCCGKVWDEELYEPDYDDLLCDIKEEYGEF